jgi:hypothetical protein
VRALIYVEDASRSASPRKYRLADLLVLLGAKRVLVDGRIALVDPTHPLVASRLYWLK